MFWSVLLTLIIWIVYDMSQNEKEEKKQQALDSENEKLQFIADVKEIINDDSISHDFTAIYFLFQLLIKMKKSYIDFLKEQIPNISEDEILNSICYNTSSVELDEIINVKENILVKFRFNYKTLELSNVSKYVKGGFIDIGFISIIIDKLGLGFLIKEKFSDGNIALKPILFFDFLINESKKIYEEQNEKYNDSNIVNLLDQSKFSSGSNKTRRHSPYKTLMNIYNNSAIFLSKCFLETSQIRNFQIHGSTYMENTIKGGGLNTAGAVVGGFIGGSTGAIIGSSLDSDIKSDNKVLDDRDVYIYYYDDDKVLQMFKTKSYDADKTYTVLSEIMPEKSDKSNVSSDKNTPENANQELNSEKSSDLLDKLERLLILKNNGIINDDEFIQLKEKLISQENQK